MPGTDVASTANVQRSASPLPIPPRSTGAATATRPRAWVAVEPAPVGEGCRRAVRSPARRREPAPRLRRRGSRAARGRRGRAGRTPRRSGARPAPRRPGRRTGERAPASRPGSPARPLRATRSADRPEAREDLLDVLDRVGDAVPSAAAAVASSTPTSDRRSGEPIARRSKRATGGVSRASRTPSCTRWWPARADVDGAATTRRAGCETVGTRRDDADPSTAATCLPRPASDASWGPIAVGDARRRSPPRSA